MTAIALMLLVQAADAAAMQGPPDRPPIVVAAKLDMVLKWNEAALQAIRVDKTAPPVAARNLAILHVAIYDAVNGVLRTHQPYFVETTPVPDASPEAAAVAAAHRSLVALFPKQRELFDQTYARCLAELPADTGRDHGLDVGRFVAERVLAWRAQDGSERVGRYTPKTSPGLWQPTLPGYRDALLPEWGYVKPFAIRKGTQHCPPGPPDLKSAAFTAAFNEVKALGGANSPARTPEQTQIAHFWVDGPGTATPPGHWNQIAQTLALQHGKTLAENARLFALLNVSLADAGVLCWVLKFTYDCWRPVTSIRTADQDGNPDTEPNLTWTPLIETPPFPAYTSGHSSFSSAGATVLANFFGSDQQRFSTTSDGLPGVVRSFTSLRAAAEEAGMSRIYGGIHWQFDNQDGLTVGRTLGDYVYRNFMQPRSRTVLRPTLPLIVDAP